MRILITTEGENDRSRCEGDKVLYRVPHNALDSEAKSGCQGNTVKVLHKNDPYDNALRDRLAKSMTD
jgi:hypothetical protein